MCNTLICAAQACLYDDKPPVKIQGANQIAQLFNDLDNYDTLLSQVHCAWYLVGLHLATLHRTRWCQRLPVCCETMVK